ncbi:MAG: SDR family oxidoreductase [Bacteroidales bacterium]|nr:SDR family oxidoreductase [Bacteroidales bacterium]
MNGRFSLEGKTLLVTGASSGIGRCVAVECAKMGAKLVINGRNQERLNQTLSMLEGIGHQAIAADLSDHEAVSAMVEQLPQLDGVSHNAGVTSIGMIKFIKADDWQALSQTNVFSAIWLTRCLVAKKKLNKPASVVFTSSISGNDSVRHGEALYAATKSALSGFAKAAALDLAPQGIRVNCVHPGMIETELFHSSQDALTQDLDEMKKLFPLKRFGNPEDVADGIIYLLSDASSWVTGTELKIDGGYTLV